MTKFHTLLSEEKPGVYRLLLRASANELCAEAEARRMAMPRRERRIAQR